MIYFALLSLLGFSQVATAHQVAWVKGMYCEGAEDDPNTNKPVDPLYNLTKSKWWFQADRGCDKQPPSHGDFLQIPAGGSFTVEIAENRAFTSLSYKGRLTSNWPDGKNHPDDWRGPGNPADCIQDAGAMHTNNESMAAGTVFAISYVSDISKVTMENLVVFSVLPNTPWRRQATYQVPANLPPCPTPGGCICAWGWVPKGCGQPNMYMAGYKCTVTGSRSRRRLAPAKAPKYCANNPNACVKGAKQIIAWMQADGNNVVKPNNAFVSYSADWGYLPGAQNDIFG